MEPLIESILKNLSHRHAYVRRNAVTCVYSIVKTFGPDVIPQASVEIEQLLLVEGDLSTKRIAFIMLLNCDIDRAIAYASSVEEQVNSLGDVFQLALLELVRKVAKTRPNQKMKLMKIVYFLSNASSPAVTFECAQILSQYANSSPSASQVAATLLVNLLVSQPDNNVKLVVIEKLETLVNSDRRHIVEALVMDILRGLACPAFGVRKRIISLVSGCLTSRNVLDVVNALKKEIVKTRAPENLGADNNADYKRLLIQTLQQACRQYPDLLADSVITVLVDILRDQVTDQKTAFEIIAFLRESLSQSPNLTHTIINELALMLPELNNRSRVARMALWMIGEFSDPKAAPGYIRSILNCLAPLPFSISPAGITDVDVDKETTGASRHQSTSATTSTAGVTSTITTKTVVLADGTYASKAVYGGVTGGSTTKTSSSSGNGIRSMIIHGDILLATVCGVVIGKLLIRSNTLRTIPDALRNEILFALTCAVRAVKSSMSFNTGKDQVSRLMHAIKIVASPNDDRLVRLAMQEWESGRCRDALTRLVVAESSLRSTSSVAGVREKQVSENPSKNVVFRVLKDKRDLLAATDVQLAAAAATSGAAANNEDSSDTIPGVLSALSNMAKVGNDPSIFSQRLSKATALTGLADSVYIEGFVRLHSFDLILELSIVNRTSETLQNILVELCTHGDLKVMDKPESVTLAPGESKTVFSTIRVSSTENGTIFGYATLDRKSALDKEWIVLNEIHADVVDYIKPHCSIMESGFKNMWQEFEWENKIVVHTDAFGSSATDFVDTLCLRTNLEFVGTADQVKSARYLLEKSKKFVAVNLYAKSIFGEDALVNVSLESGDGGQLNGTVRIRARTQGIALSIGDKVNQVQKEHVKRGA